MGLAAQVWAHGEELVDADSANSWGPAPHIVLVITVGENNLQALSLLGILKVCKPQVEHLILCCATSSPEGLAKIVYLNLMRRNNADLIRSHLKSCVAWKL